MRIREAGLSWVKRLLALFTVLLRETNSYQRKPRTVS